MKGIRFASAAILVGFGLLSCGGTREGPAAEQVTSSGKYNVVIRIIGTSAFVPEKSGNGFSKVWVLLPDAEQRTTAVRRPACENKKGDFPTHTAAMSFDPRTLSSPVDHPGPWVMRLDNADISFQFGNTMNASVTPRPGRIPDNEGNLPDTPADATDEKGFEWLADLGRLEYNGTPHDTVRKDLVAEPISDSAAADKVLSARLKLETGTLGTHSVARVGSGGYALMRFQVDSAYGSVAHDPEAMSDVMVLRVEGVEGPTVVTIRNFKGEARTSLSFDGSNSQGDLVLSFHNQPPAAILNPGVQLHDHYRIFRWFYDLVEPAYEKGKCPFPAPTNNLGGPRCPHTRLSMP